MEEMPELPEGLKWRVVKAEDTLEVQIVKPGTETELVEVERPYSVPHLFGRGTRTKTKTVVEEVECYTVLQSFMLRDVEMLPHSHISRPLNTEDTARYMELKAKGWDTQVTSFGTFMVRNWEISKESVLAGAKKCLERYRVAEAEKEEERIKEERTQELVGLYPPKKL